MLSFGELVEDQDGLYWLGEVNVFHLNAERSSCAVGEVPLREQAVAAWVEWMRADQRCRVVELPRTARTLAWGCGSVFVVTPRDGRESRVFAVAVGQFGFQLPKEAKVAPCVDNLASGEFGLRADGRVDGRRSRGAAPP